MLVICSSKCNSNKLERGVGGGGGVIASIKTVFGSQKGTK